MDDAASGGVRNSGERDDAGSETATRGAAAGGRKRDRSNDRDDSAGSGDNGDSGNSGGTGGSGGCYS